MVKNMTTSLLRLYYFSPARTQVRIRCKKDLAKLLNFFRPSKSAPSNAKLLENVYTLCLLELEEHVESCQTSTIKLFGENS